jgi:hypothetical protein
MTVESDNAVSVVETVDRDNNVWVWTLVTVEVVVNLVVEVKVLVAVRVLLTVTVATARANGQNARLTSSQVLLEGRFGGPLGE